MGIVLILVGTFLGVLIMYLAFYLFCENKISGLELAIIGSIGFALIWISLTLPIILKDSFVSTADEQLKPTMTVTQEQYTDIQDIEWILDRYQIVIEREED